MNLANCGVNGCGNCLNAQNANAIERPCIVVNSFAEAYVADQEMTEIYCGKEGLIIGTIFPELDIPYLGRDEYMGRGRR